MQLIINDLFNSLRGGQNFEVRVYYVKFNILFLMPFFIYKTFIVGEEKKISQHFKFKEK